MKKIIINILFIIFLFIITEFLLEIVYFHKLFQAHISADELKNYSKKEYISKILFNIKEHFSAVDEYTVYDFRKPSGMNYIGKKPAIVLMGCSFTYGTNLNDDETFSSQLAQYNHRPVINLGTPGIGPREVLYMLITPVLNDIYPQEINNNVEYVIYTYIYDHNRRIFTNIKPLAPKFKKQKDGSLKYIKGHNFIDLLFIKRSLKELLFDKGIYPNQKLTDETLILYINEINKAIHKKFKNGEKQTKLVVLVYSNDEIEPLNNIEKNNKDIIILKLNDLADIDIFSDKYTIIDEHPNKKVWEILVPIISKKLDL